MRFKHKFLLVCTLVLGLLARNSYNVQAQTTVRSFTDSRKIVIGDQIKLWLEIKPESKGDKIIWPQMPDSLVGLEIVGKDKIDTLASKDSFVLRQRVLVTGFDSGSFYIPSFQFQVISNGQTSTYNTDSIPVNIQTVAVDTTKAFKPIKEIVEVPFSIWEYWKEMLGGVLLLALCIFITIYLYRRNKKKRTGIVDKVPPELAHQKALRLLQELKSKKYFEQGRSKEYFSELSDLLRTYLEERYHITAMEQTTDELLSLLKKQNDAKAELRKVRPQLKLILRTADLAKFAKANPLPDEYNACMDAAIEVIQRTQFKEEEGTA